MTFSIIQKSQLEGAQRIDAEYYQREYLEAKQGLKKWSTVQLSDFCRIADGDHAAIPGFVDHGGERYLRAKDLQSFFIDDSDPVYVSEDYFAKLKRSHIKPFDIVLSIMGTVGNLAIVPPENGIMTANRAVAIISPRNQEKFISSFVAIYLETKYGVLQRLRESMGGVQLRVNLDDLAKIKIPILGLEQQRAVSNAFDEAVRMNKKSKKLYQQAEELLLGELGLKDFDEENDLFSIINYDEIESAKRTDAEYFQPKYLKLLEKLKSIQTAKLGSLLKEKSSSTKVSRDNNYKYIEISDVNVSDGSVAYNEMLGKELPASAKIPLTGGELIISKVRPTRGAIAVMPSNFSDHFICSGAFSVFNGKENLSEYLFVALRSIVGKLQLERPCTGTSYPTITDQDVKNVIIPILPQPIQQKIADLVRKSHTFRQKSKELLEEAKRKVEEMIEKGGE